MHDTVFIHSGLGNQMFEYAFYLYRKRINPHTTCNMGLLKDRKVHNGFELNKIFNINIKSAPLQTFLVRACNYSRIFKTLARFLDIEIITDKEIAIENKNNYFVGYWQDEQFFKDIKKEVKNSFIFNEKLLSKQTIEFLRQIKSSNSISIHIRRGDYTLEHFNKIYGGICTVDYYKRAIEHICSNIKEPIFFCFSEDIEWIKQNLNIPNAQYVDCNRGENSWQDMYLMTQCKHNIVANSTFSWWGAWLNNNPSKIIICPTKFDNTGASANIFPDTWIKI